MYSVFTMLRQRMSGDGEGGPSVRMILGDDLDGALRTWAKEVQAIVFFLYTCVSLQRSRGHQERSFMRASAHGHGDHRKWGA